MSAIAPPSTERNLNTFSISVDGSEPIRKNTNIITTVKINAARIKVNTTRFMNRPDTFLSYTGCRIGELLDLKKEDVNLEDRYFKIIASKTAAGIRTAPIAEKVYPLFEYWYNLNDCEYLLSTPDGEHFKYRNYYDSYWMPLIDTLGMKHRPHDTRHTCISMLTVAGVSDKVIKKIVGHKGQGVTEVVYTHFEIEELIDAINKI